ncbi:hypothetical protein FHS83_003086 [Rhizomicrobium palustre]|uniref:Uncharacterized protein n=1 Tax=Rhizomicrobium palustre TaxID=189966 RepID=A0A846N1F5_9PROT|nr:hypothetical protein [Rhizomicrobium palustre]NIK89768.1 hypothetical protein [Rhizomicrobium palustre]
MNTRRHCLITMAAVASMSAAHASLAYEVLKRGPCPKLVPGKPDKVDFGHGLLIPMSKDAFHTLWEGDDRFIAYGHGFGQSEAAAMGQAEEAAIGTMKLYLLTLAFAPDRLMHIDGGGWVLKSGKTEDLVKGDVELKGRPVMPTTDTKFSYSANEAAGGDAGDETRGGGGAVHATTGWLIWKSDADLEYVRQHAHLLAP